ncbi:kinase-like domain-containing protein [Coniochaeta sp. 2T2.1]|nr:kinase-like domain-containing protein [Coniochaeta sp. 2T2.1]
MEAISTWIMSNFQLKARLLWAMETGTGLHGPEKYLPYITLDRLITPTEVAKQIQKLDHRLPRATRQALVRHICRRSNVPRPDGAQALPYYLDTTCKRIFAILILIDGVSLELLFYLERKRVRDVDLLLPSNGRLGEGSVAAEFYRLLGLDRRTKFARCQWKVLAPIFQNRPGGEVPVYQFGPGTILPWTIHSKNSMLGTTSNVYLMKIDRRNRHLQFFTREGTDLTEVALKEFMDCIEEAAFDAEVTALKRFTSDDNPHITELLAAFERDGRFYLICPLAQSNLTGLLQSTDPRQCADDKTLKRWIFAQCLGLATALSRIHVFKTADSQTGITKTEYGAHGDIKPENILWYNPPSSSSPNTTTTTPLPSGVLQICDFGQAAWLPSSSSSSSSSDNTPESLNGNGNDGEHLSAVYRAPEQYYPTRVARSQESDVFALGCIFLGLAVWFVQGPEALARFAEERRREREPVWVWDRVDGDRVFGHGDGVEDGGERRKGRYFKFVADAAGREFVPVFKRVVVEKIEALRRQADCLAVWGLVSYVYENMLQLDDSRRPRCDWVVEVLRALLAGLDAPEDRVAGEDE